MVTQHPSKTMVGSKGEALQEIQTYNRITVGIFVLLKLQPLSTNGLFTSVDILLLKGKANIYNTALL